MTESELLDRADPRVKELWRIGRGVDSLSKAELEKNLDDKDQDELLVIRYGYKFYLQGLTFLERTVLSGKPYPDLIAELETLRNVERN